MENNFNIRLSATVNESILKSNIASLKDKFTLSVKLHLNTDDIQSQLDKIKPTKAVTSKTSAKTTGKVIGGSTTIDLATMAGVEQVSTTLDAQGDILAQVITQYTDLQNKAVSYYTAAEDGELELNSVVKTTNFEYKKRLQEQEKIQKEMDKASARRFKEKTKQWQQENKLIEKNANTYDKLAKQIDAFASRSRLSKRQVTEFTNELENIKKKGLDPIDESKALEKLGTDIKLASEKVGLLGQPLNDVIKKFATWYLVAGGVTGAINAIKDVVRQVTLLDTKLVELKKVTDLTSNGLREMTDRAFVAGRQLGTTADQVLSATTEFARAGYEAQDAFNLAKVAITLTNVAENINDAGEAATYLISILKGANLEISEASRLLDELNEVSNNFAVDLGTLADMVQRITGTMTNFGNSIEETMALVTGAYEVLQDERVARGISTIAARIAGLNEDLEAEEGLANQVSEALMKYADIDVFDMNGQLRDTYDILEELSTKWDYLSKNAQSVLLNIVAGKNRMDVLSSIMTNWEGVAASLEATTEAEGSAANEQNAYLESVEGKLQAFANAWQEVADATIGSDVIKWFIDLGTAIVQLIADTGGLVNTLLFLNGIIQSFKLSKYINDLRGLSSTVQEFTIATKGAAAAEQTFTVTTQAATTAATKFKASLGIISIIAGAIGLISGIVEGIRSAREAAEEARKERIANTKEDLQATQDLRTEYNEFIATIEDEEELNDKISEQYDKLAKKARAYGIAIRDANGELKDYLSLSQELELQQLKQLERDMRRPAEEAKKFLGKSSRQTISGGAIETRGYADVTFEGTPEERIAQMQAWLDNIDETITGEGLSYWAQFTYDRVNKALSELQEQVEEKVGLVDDYIDVWAQTTFQKNFKAIFDEYEKSFAEWQDKSKRDQVTSAQAQIESLDQFVEQVVSKYPELEEYVNNLTKAMYGAYDEAKHYDIVLDMFDKKLADIRAQQKLDEKELETQEKLLKVEQARAALAEAENKRIKVFRAGKNFVYEQDVEAVQEAQTALTEAERSAGVDELSRATANIETLIEYYNQAVKDDREELYNYFSEEKNLLEFEAMTFEQKLEALERFIKDTDWNAVKPRVDVTGYNASGTRSWRGGTTWVGENGPELVNLPQGTEILSNTRSMRLARLADSPSSFAKGGSTANNMIFNGNLNFPNVRTADDANGFISALQALATPKMATFH